MCIIFMPLLPTLCNVSQCRLQHSLHVVVNRSATNSLFFQNRRSDVRLYLARQYTQRVVVLLLQKLPSYSQCNFCAHFVRSRYFYIAPSTIEMHGRLDYLNDDISLPALDTGWAKIRSVIE